MNKTTVYMRDGTRMVAPEHSEDTDGIRIIRKVDTGVLAEGGHRLVTTVTFIPWTNVARVVYESETVTVPTVPMRA